MAADIWCWAHGDEVRLGCEPPTRAEADDQVNQLRSGDVIGPLGTVCMSAEIFRHLFTFVPGPGEIRYMEVVSSIWEPSVDRPYYAEAAP